MPFVLATSLLLFGTILFEIEKGGVKEEKYIHTYINILLWTKLSFTMKDYSQDNNNIAYIGKFNLILVALSAVSVSIT